MGCFPNAGCSCRWFGTGYKQVRDLSLDPTSQLKGPTFTQVTASGHCSEGYEPRTSNSQRIPERGRCNRTSQRNHAAFHSRGRPMPQTTLDPTMDTKATRSHGVLKKNITGTSEPIGPIPPNPRALGSALLAAPPAAWAKCQQGLWKSAEVEWSMLLMSSVCFPHPWLVYA